MTPKTDIYGGKSPRELPLYTIADAARVVRIPPATLRMWVLGRSYSTHSGEKRWSPLIRIADRKNGRLSFANLVEVHVLGTLRGKQVRVERIRSATTFIRDRMRTEHPLADVDTHTDCVDIYVEYLGRLVSASSSQVALRPLLERYLERIERDENGLASRLFPITRDDGLNARAVLIDPSRRFGRPVLAYARSVGLDADARYYGGARLRPVVPLDTAVNGIFILGAYPSARFEAVGSENDVPVGDNLGPFEPERYFDGTRVRTQKSADELKDFYLAPLGIDRRDCWITDIVKVFLFKDGHRQKYRRLGTNAPVGYERERFDELALKSIGWLGRELVVAKPRLVVTLGAEIAGLLRGVKSQRQRNALLGPGISPLRLGSIVVPTVHLAHPGIVMRKGNSSRNPWPRVHEEEHIPQLRAALVHA